MKRAIYSALVCLLVVLMSVFVLIGLEAKVEAQTKVIELVYASGLARTSYLGGILPEEWIARVNKALEGRVHIRGVHDGALLNHAECLEGLEKGVADVTNLSTGYYPSKLPMSAAFATVLDFGIGTKIGFSGQVGITHQLMSEFPEMRKEFKDLGITYLFSLPGCSYLLWSTKPIRTIEDLKGKRFRTYGSKMPLMVKAVGATPMAVDWGEVYTSLSTGLCDVVFTDGEAGYPMKWHEPASWLIRTGLMTATSVIAIGINTKSLERLSKADQDTFLKISKEFTTYAPKRLEDLITKELWAKYEKDGITFRELPAKEYEKWATVCPDWYGEVAKELNKKGLPGDKFAGRYKELANDFFSGKWKP